MQVAAYVRVGGALCHRPRTLSARPAAAYDWFGERSGADNSALGAATLTVIL